MNLEFAYFIFLSCLLGPFALFGPVGMIIMLFGVFFLYILPYRIINGEWPDMPDFTSEGRN